MKTERVDLEEDIQVFLRSILGKKDVRRKIEEHMLKKGYNQGVILSMLNLNTIPEMWANEDLFVLLEAIDSLDYDDKLSINKYLTKAEIAGTKQYKKVNIKNNTRDWTFKKVTKLNKNEQYLTCITIQELREMVQDIHIVGYDPDIQRELIRRKQRGKETIIEKPNINPKKVCDIENSTIHDLQYASAIQFNVITLNDKDININENEISIHFDKDTSMSVIMGAHRVEAYCKAVTQNPNLFFNIPIILSFLDKNKAGDAIAQEDKFMHIKKSKAKKLTISDLATKLAKDINMYGAPSTNEMFGKIADDEQELRLKGLNKYCTLDCFSEALRNNFNITNETTIRELRKIQNLVVSGMNEIIGWLKEGNKLNNIKEKTIYLNENMFIGYVAILSQIKDESINNLGEMIDLIMPELNLKEDSKELKEINFFTKRYTKANIEKISRFFVERSNIYAEQTK